MDQDSVNFQKLKEAVLSFHDNTCSIDLVRQTLADFFKNDSWLTNSEGEVFSKMDELEAFVF